MLYEVITDRLAQVAIGRRDDPDIDIDIACSAESANSYNFV